MKLCGYVSSRGFDVVLHNELCALENVSRTTIICPAAEMPKRGSQSVPDNGCLFYHAVIQLIVDIRSLHVFERLKMLFMHAHRDHVVDHFELKTP